MNKLRLVINDAIMRCKTKHDLHYAICAKFEFEVLGNIYYNPELFDEGET
jgi:hypothetical protein